MAGCQIYPFAEPRRKLPKVRPCITVRKQRPDAFPKKPKRFILGFPVPLPHAKQIELPPDPEAFY